MNTIVIEAKQCPNCGGLMAAGALSGLCPNCLLAQGAEAPQPEPTRFHPPPIEELRKLFPQLEVAELLGAGGMGAVYKARQPALDRWVALKILPAQNGGGTNFTERFNREARALARLSHPHIVAVHEFGQAGNLHYFIMEYVDGANLRQLERAGRLSSREALQVIPQICDALQYAHDEGVVHRDIKPENVLVDRKGRVKIADFGLARIMGQAPDAHRLTVEGQVMGTPHYMAPEQVDRPLSVDHRADIYSLGVVFYEMLTGELPLGKFPPPSRKVQLDIRLDEVVLRALENDPERRFQKASEVKSHVENISTNPGATSQPGMGSSASPSGAPSASTPRQRQYLYWAGFPVVEEVDGERAVSWNGTLSAAACGLLFIAVAWLLVGLITGHWSTPGGSRLALILVALTVGWGVRRALNQPTESELPKTPQGTVILPPKRWWRWKYTPFLAIALIVFVWGVIAGKTRESRTPPDGIKVAQSARKSSSHVYAARLPGRGVVELLAIGTPNAAPNGWWAPDGSPITNAFYDVRAAVENSSSHRSSKDVLFRIRDLPEGASMAGLSAAPLSGASSGGRVFVDGKPLEGGLQVRFAWPHGVDEADIRVGFALKPWRTIATANASRTSQTSERRHGDPNWKVQFYNQPADTKSGAQVSLLFGPDSRMWVHRAVAIDTNGTIHEANGAQGSPIESLFLWSYTFDKLPPAAVKEFQVQVRPVHWVDFPDVALKPSGRMPRPVKVAFGPVVESAFDEVIDFDTGVTTNFPSAAPGENLFASIGNNARWMQQSGFDAEAGNGEMRPFDMDFYQLKDGDWDTISPLEAQNLIYQTYYRPERLKPENGSSTYLFKTREHAVGLLQFVGFDEGRPGVKLRYKLVRRGS